MKTNIIFYSLFFLVLVNSCVKKPDFPIEPKLEFIRLDKNTMSQGDLNTDSITVYLKFTDGDGDIGFDTKDSLQNLFVIDSRTGNFAERIKIPKLPDLGIGNGVSGEIELLLYTTCCLYKDNIPPCSVIDNIKYDTLTYKIFLVDRANHSSDTIETTPIILRCE